MAANRMCLGRELLISFVAANAGGCASAANVGSLRGSVKPTRPRARGAADRDFVCRAFDKQTQRGMIRAVHAQRTLPSARLPVHRRLTALLAVALLCWVGFLAVSPTVHHDTCGHDSQSSQHQCAATLLSKGQVTPASPAILLVVTELNPVAFVETPAAAPAAVDYSLPPGRAPPSCLA